MTEQRPERDIEERLRETAQHMRYPLTPDVAAGVRQRLAHERAQGRGPAGGIRRRRRLQLAITALAALLLVGMFSVPEVRAGILRLLRIGSVQVDVLTPTPAPSSPAAAARATPLVPEPTALPSVLQLAGATTLEHAQRELPFDLRLPSYPPELGPPDRVYLQNLAGAAVILAWSDPAEPGRVMLALHALSRDALIQKGASYSQIQETTVAGRPALWVSGEHLVQVAPGSDLHARRLVEGNTLIWTDEAGVTYRLETDQSLEEARRIAESLREIAR